MFMNAISIPLTHVDTDFHFRFTYVPFSLFFPFFLLPKNRAISVAFSSAALSLTFPRWSMCSGWIQNCSEISKLLGKFIQNCSGYFSLSSCRLRATNGPENQSISSESSELILQCGLLTSQALRCLAADRQLAIDVGTRCRWCTRWEFSFPIFSPYFFRSRSIHVHKMAQNAKINQYSSFSLDLSRFRCASLLPYSDSAKNGVFTRLFRLQQIHVEFTILQISFFDFTCGL